MEMRGAGLDGDVRLDSHDPKIVDQNTGQDYPGFMTPPWQSSIQRIERPDHTAIGARV